MFQVTDTVALKEVSIQKKRNIKEIIKNITKNIDKNYPKAVNHHFDINQISIREVDTVMAFNRVENLEVFLKFKKDESLNKYLLDSLHANSLFKDSTSIKKRTTYYKHHSSTSIKRKSEAFDNCKNEEINLRDLGLYF